MTNHLQSILFICMGNICRSPAAHAVMEQLNKKHQLGWRIDSCGTHAYHHKGALPDSRMQKVLQEHGYSKFKHSSQPFDIGMAYEFDLLLAMDLQNYEYIREKLCHDQALLEKLYLFRYFDPQVASEFKNNEVPDPYYNGDKSFQEVYQMIVRTCESLAKQFGPC